MENKGYIFLHKSLLNWEWYTDLPTAHLFIHLLLKANFSQNKWKGITINRGQLITSLNHLYMGTGLSLQQVRTSLGKLIKSGVITKQSSSKNTLITIINYEKYQNLENINNKQKNKPKTHLQQTNNKPITTTNEDNKQEIINNEFNEGISALDILKNDKLFWDKTIQKYADKVIEFDSMCQKFELKMKEEKFPLELDRLTSRFERWVLSWIENQNFKKDTPKKLVKNRNE